MISPLVRCLFILCSCTLLAGCSLSTLNIPVTGDARLFAESLDQYIATGDLVPLKKVPEGEWRPRAEKVVALAEKQKQQQALLEKNKQELSFSQQEKEALSQDIKKLEATLNQLKEVLIDTELQPK